MTTKPLPERADPPVIDKRPLDQRAAAVMRQRIMSGTFPPGFRLVEVKLSEELKLSRGTIRAALNGLGHEGLVIQTAYTKWEVAEFSADDAWELFTLRSVLEGLAARLATERITSAECRELWSAFERLEAAAETADWDELTATDFMLHKTIIDIARHGRLAQQYRVLEQQVRLLIASSNSLVPTLADVVAQHRPLVESITSGQAAQAEELAREHNLAEGRVLIAYASHANGIEGNAGLAQSRGFRVGSIAPDAAQGASSGNGMD